MDALKVYHNSPAYLSWVASKGKADVEMDVDDADKNTRRNVGGGGGSVRNFGGGDPVRVG